MKQWVWANTLLSILFEYTLCIYRVNYNIRIKTKMQDKWHIVTSLCDNHVQYIWRKYKIRYTDKNFVVCTKINTSKHDVTWWGLIVGDRTDNRKYLTEK